MSTSELVILSILAEQDGPITLHDLNSAVRSRLDDPAEGSLVFSFGRRSVLDTVYELNALGAVALDAKNEDDPRLKLTAHGRQVAAGAFPAI